METRIKQRLFPSVLLALVWSSLLSPAFPATQATLIGRIVDSETALPLVSSSLVLRQGDEEWRLASDGEGRFTFLTLAAGEYELRAEAEDHHLTLYKLILHPRQTLNVTVELVRRSSLEQSVEVVSDRTRIDPGQTGSARLITSRSLELLPATLSRDVQTLAVSQVPGTVISHDNFLHLRGNELSLHQFINGVSFLDNTHQHFTAGPSPRIFESVNFVTGGFPAEFGNRFGGVLDITTKSAGSLSGHGALNLGIGTGLNQDASAEFGFSKGRLGFYMFGSGLQSGRYLNPPIRREIHDRGRRLQGTFQLDYQGDQDFLKLYLDSGGSNFELPNTVEEAELGRDAFRRIRSGSSILTWEHHFSGFTSLTTSLYQRSVSDRLLGTGDAVTPFGEGSRSTLTVGAKSDLLLSRGGHTIKAGLDVSLFRLRESFRFDPRPADEHDDDPGDHHDEGEEHDDEGEEHHDEGEEHPDEQALLELLRVRRDLGGSPGIRFSSASALEAFDFGGRDLGGQTSLYLQDHFSPVQNLTLDLGLRWDQLNLVGSEAQISPRFGISYYFPDSGSVLHFNYNRLFTPPPLEYVVLASYLGNEAREAELEEGHSDVLLGNVRAYTQNFFEVGWSQEFHRNLVFDLNTYHHRGQNAFETSEISNTRLFAPTNFRRAESSGAEASLRFDGLDELGIGARIQYSLAKVRFFGPVSGGVAGESHGAGEALIPAFDQLHTGTASIHYRSKWRGFWSNLSLAYGSGTPVEQEVEIDGAEFEQVVRLPDHLTANFGTGLTLWNDEPHRLDLEFSIENLSDNIYRIGKESATTPFQFASRRIVSGRLIFRF